MTLLCYMTTLSFATWDLLCYSMTRGEGSTPTYRTLQLIQFCRVSIFYTLLYKICNSRIFSCLSNHTNIQFLTIEVYRLKPSIKVTNHLCREIEGTSHGPIHQNESHQIVDHFLNPNSDKEPLYVWEHIRCKPIFSCKPCKLHLGHRINIQEALDKGTYQMQILSVQTIHNYNKISIDKCITIAILQRIKVHGNMG